MENKKYTFWEFLKEHKIEIPIIQRDYAQGRTGKEALRSRFLQDLKSALDKSLHNNKEEMKLDFVYGKDENKILNPLDGQQRLTTLWLLHWYVAYRSNMLGTVNGKANKISEIFSKFSYETRDSSRDFCKKLSVFNIPQPDGDTIAEHIQNQTWFRSAWKQDPTIQSMLRMLSGTPDKENIDGIEKVFSIFKINYLHLNHFALIGLEQKYPLLYTTMRNNPHEPHIQSMRKILIGGLYLKDNVGFEKESNIFKQDYWGILSGKDCPIMFYYLDLLGLKQSDDLYIKMNARGEQLTSFENFKADLIGYINEQNKPNNIDDWAKFLNPTNGIPIKMDTDWTDIFWKNKSSDYRIDEIYFAFINRYFLNALITLKDKQGNYKYDQVDFETEGKCIEFDYLYGQDPKGIDKTEDSRIAYTTIDKYKIDDSIPYNTLHSLECTLNNYAKWIKGTNIVIKTGQRQIPYTPKYIIPEYFIPIYDAKENFKNFNGEDIMSIKDITQPERVKFYAFCKFFEKNDYENLTSVGYSEQLEDWLRVTINIIDNANINTIDSMVGCMRLIDELSDNTNDILQYLNTAPKLKSSFAKDQTDEEIEKAKRILNPNSVKCPKEFFNWKEAIKATENYAFFHGSIRFLYTNEYGNVNWNDFGTKWENAKRYFGSQKRDNAEILRLFISNCSKWAKLQEITYDERDATWKVNLTNKELFNVTHNFLMNSVPNLTTFMSKFSSKLAETQGAAHEDLVKTKLLANLRYNRNNVDGCKLRDNIHDLIALFPSGATSEQKKYVIGHYRNEYLNELLKNHGITTQQKVGNCDFFWGWDIYFEYSGKKFLWDTKDDIYLIDEKGNKINSNNPFKINVGINKVIFIKELEKLIIEKNRGY